MEGWAIMRTHTPLNAQTRPENGLFSTHTISQHLNIRGSHLLTHLDFLNKGVDVFSISTQFHEISLTSLGGAVQARRGLSSRWSWP